MDFKRLSEYQCYEPLKPDLEEWPITLFSNARKSFLTSLNKDVYDYYEGLPKEDVDQAIARTIYLEKQRVKSNPWKADPPGEMQYFRKIQKEYNENQLLPDKAKANMDTLARLIKRYSQEIIGHFNSNTFLTTRKISDFFFHFLLYPFGWRSLFNLKRMHDANKKAIRLNGHCQEVRALFEEHVVVLVPTHSSNLDSILVGYSVDASLGLPAFSYGAGLNLFDSEFFAFFMNRLGAYKVDRRKKNSIYLQTLNSYSKRSILEGVNTIFFPGGTRSRSGEVESKVKLGLLGSLVQAQRIFLEQGSSKKVVVVPVVIGYESVLEARSLIIQYLRTTGQEKYTARVKRPGIGSYLRFARRLLRMGSSITLTYGAPMDVFGNRLGSNGESYDHHGKQIQISDYFKTEGQLAADSQREMIYTRELGDQIGKAYQNYNYILPAHLVAYAAFKLLSRMHPQMDIYSVVQIPEEDFVFPRKGFEMLCGQVRTLLFERAEQGQLIYPAELEGELTSVIRKGIQTLGIFHIQRVLMIDEFGRLMSEDFLGLLYYSNKMTNMELDEAINWAAIPFDLVDLED